MKRQLLIALVAASATGSMVAASLAQAPPGPVGGDAQRSPEDRARRAKVVAKVGKVIVTVGDVEDRIHAQSPFMRSRYRDPERLRDFVQSHIIRVELLAAAAEQRRYGSDPIVVRSIKQNTVQHLIRREFDERITPDSIPMEDVQAYYDTHQAEFHRAEMRRAAHILTSTREEAVALIEKAVDADARGFRQLAREHSIDNETKMRGGDLRYFTREGRPPNSRDARVDEALVEAAFGLEEVGDVASSPVQLGDRFSVLKLSGRRPVEHRTVEEAGQGIRLRLWRERRQQALDDFVAGLRSRYNTVVHEELLAAIQLDAAPPGAGHPGLPTGPSKAGPGAGPALRLPGKSLPRLPGKAVPRPPAGMQ